MDENARATQIVMEKMLQNDAFSRWLGIRVTAIKPGYCLLQATITPDMTNGFGICHGGVLFSLADSALAFASNGHGRHALSIETSVSLFRPARVGDTVSAEATEVFRSHTTAWYEVDLQTNGNLLGRFRGTVHVKNTEWLPPVEGDSV